MNADLLARAVAVAQRDGPLIMADDVTDNGLASAYANNSIRLPGWCECKQAQEQAYYSNPANGSHGWLCCACRKTTQTG